MKTQARCFFFDLVASEEFCSDKKTEARLFFKLTSCLTELVITSVIT